MNKSKLPIRVLILTFGLIATGSILQLHVGNESTGAQTLSNSWKNSNANPPLKPFVDDFSPEFSNLPTFDEIMETSTRDGGKLIEVAEFLYSDKPWPSYSRNDLGVQNGERWLGLYAAKGKLRFIETKLTRSPREGFIGPGDQPEDWLKFETKGDLLLLTKGIAGLKPGGVATLFRKKLSFDSVYLEHGFRRTFKLAGVEYTLRVTTGLQRDGGKVNVLVLESEGKSQIVTFNLYYKDHNTLYHSIGELLWVGDMDNDSRLDLYFSDYGYEKGGFGSNLYLSSPASGEDLLDRVAGFSSAGC